MIRLALLLAGIVAALALLAIEVVAVSQPNPVVMALSVVALVALGTAAEVFGQP